MFDRKTEIIIALVAIVLFVVGGSLIWAALDQEDRFKAACNEAGGVYIYAYREICIDKKVFIEVEE